MLRHVGVFLCSACSTKFPSSKIFLWDECEGSPNWLLVMKHLDSRMNGVLKFSHIEYKGSRLTRFYWTSLAGPYYRIDFPELSILCFALSARRGLCHTTALPGRNFILLPSADSEGSGLDCGYSSYQLRNKSCLLDGRVTPWFACTPIGSDILENKVVNRAER